MEIIGNRIGTILKYGKVMGRPMKRYFFIDNEGILHYTEHESIIKELLASPNKTNKILVDMIKSECKQIKLNDCSLSSIKPFLEKDFDLHNRSHFEVFVKSRDFRSLILFAYREDYTISLYEFISSFKESFGDIMEEKTVCARRETLDDDMKSNLERFVTRNDEGFYQRHYSTSSGLKKDEKNMDEILVKLEGKFMNQENWQKEHIKIVNPMSKSESYIEELCVLENNSTFSGQVKDGMPNGNGKEFRKDGSLYSGRFYQGKWHGNGTITNENLDSFSGEFLDGCICGI
jgi:hypothetical protein